MFLRGTSRPGSFFSNDVKERWHVKINTVNHGISAGIVATREKSLSILTLCLASEGSKKKTYADYVLLSCLCLGFFTTAPDRYSQVQDTEKQKKRSFISFSKKKEMKDCSALLSFSFISIFCYIPLPDISCSYSWIACQIDIGTSLGRRHN